MRPMLHVSDAAVSLGVVTHHQQPCARPERKQLKMRK